MIKRLCRNYIIRRQIKALITLPALQLPAAYIKLERSIGTITIDRTKSIPTTVPEIGLYLDWINVQLGVIVQSHSESPVFNGIITERDIRIDSLLYDRTKGKYIEFSEIMQYLAEAYQLFDTALADRTHQNHYYVKGRIVRHVESIHNILVDIIKSI